MTTATFSNPLPVPLGDPYILYTQGTYYLYGTGAGADKGFAAYSSKDMVNWKREGQVYFYDNPQGWSDPTAKWGGAMILVKRFFLMQAYDSKHRTDGSLTRS